MKKNWKWPVAALLIAIVLIGGWRALSARRAVQVAQSQQAAQPAEPTVELAQADVVRAEQRELQRGLPSAGSLKAVNSAFVKARVAGELQGLALREGDAAQAGQVIARVDPVEVRARMQQAQEQADAARAQIDIAERQFNNNKALVDQGFISRSALDTSQNNLAAAQATHKAALAAVDVVRKALDDTVLRAVTKNAILLVDFAIRMREQGMERSQALLHAARVRLRPMMTTLAMVFGMVPLAFALTEGSEQRAPMGQAVIGGVITSSLLTLVVVPVVYCYLDDLAQRLRSGRPRGSGGAGAEPVAASKMDGLS